jgi:hypothetical protein
MIWVGVFAIAMGYMESAVVVYLRTIYYPGGFSFPLKSLSREIGITELFREAATMVMLAVIGWIAANKFITRFAMFIYAFAIWDICYYLFLYLLIGWPSTPLEWDILFLIPVTWTGPVIAPVINSFTMILLAVLIVYAEYRGVNPKISGYEWILLVTGSAITIGAYIFDYAQYSMRSSASAIDVIPDSDYIPQYFNWWLFGLGEVLFIAALFGYWRRVKSENG